MRRAIGLLGLLGLVLAGEARAESDVQLWTKAGVSGEVAEDVDFGVDLHLRFDENVSRVESLMPDAEIQYALQKWLRLGAGYRFQYMRNGDGDLVVRHRLHAEGSLRLDLDDVRLEYRLRFQEQIRPSSNDTTRQSLRNRAKASYRGVDRWTPAATAELFHALGDGDTIHLDKYRLTAGIAYERKKWEVGVFYGLEVPVNVPIDEIEATLHIIGVGYTREL